MQATNYYFFRTVKVEGRPRLRPLPGQTESNGNPINESLNVQADSIMRGSYPIGTVFGSESLELRSHSNTPFYSAGAIYPMGLSLGDYIVGSHMPSKEMTNAYNEYRNREIRQNVESQTLFTSSGEASQPGSLLEQIKADKSLKMPTIKDDGFFIEPKNWHLLVRNIKNRINTMLVGPSGCGKTELIILACSKLGIPCRVYDMGAMQDPISGLLGVHRLGKNGESVFDYARFTQDIQEECVIVLDEISRARELNLLFPCLDSRRTLPVEIAAGKDVRSIPVNPKCCFFATANVGSEYTGTMSMDRALVGRFFPMELDYMPSGEEALVLSRRHRISTNDAANIVAVAETVRSLYSKGELSTSLSTRETLQAASLVCDGWSAMDAMELTFLPLFEGTRNDGERSIVSKIFLTR